MFKQKFFNFEEARDALGATHESLRQALLSGGVPAYLETRQDSALFVSPSDADEKMPADGRSSLGSWVRNILVKESPIYSLSGWFRVDPKSLAQAARFGAFRDRPRVTAPEGCEDFFSDGDYFDFSLTTYGNCQNPLIVLDTFKYQPELVDLWFDAATLDSLIGGPSFTTLSTDIEPHVDRLDSTEGRSAKPIKLRSDREETLLRVIAGLWALSGLPSEHNTTADKLSGLFDSWGWDKPAKSTIADVVLKRALNLPGAVIRKSD